MRDRAAKRRHGPYPYGRNLFTRFREKRCVVLNSRRARERLNRGQRTDLEAAILGNGRKRLERAKTNHIGGPCEALFHQIDEAGPARDQLRFGAIPRQKLESLLEAPRMQVTEGG